MTQKYDIVIVGGGMVGASLALLLREQIKNGLSVALIDVHAATPVNLLQPSFDARTTALSLGTKRILEQLNQWSGLQHHACAIEHIQVSQQKQLGRIRLHAQDSQVEAMGFVLENRVLGQQLWQSLIELEGLTLLAPAKVESYQINGQGAQLTLNKEGEKIELSCELLVLADGANSEGCAQLGITQKRFDYQQSALVCNINFDQPHENWAFERFTLDGPLALLPMSNNRFGLVWCMSADQAAEKQNLNEADFKAALQKILGYKMGRLQRIGERQTYPLSLVQAQEQVRSHVVVLGNAAHALHPVAGQGFNLALRDCVALAQQIKLHLNKDSKENLGNLSVLNKYLASVQSDQFITTTISHGLPISFTQKGTGFSLLRAMGMTAMDISPVMKKLFAKQAMGLVGGTQPWRP